MPYANKSFNVTFGSRKGILIMIIRSSIIKVKFLRNIFCRVWFSKIIEQTCVKTIMHKPWVEIELT